MNIYWLDTLGKVVVLLSLIGSTVMGVLLIDDMINYVGIGHVVLLIALVIIFRATAVSLLKGKISC